MNMFYFYGCHCAYWDSMDENNQQTRNEKVSEAIQAKPILACWLITRPPYRKPRKFYGKAITTVIAYDLSIEGQLQNAIDEQSKMYKNEYDIYFVSWCTLGACLSPSMR